MSYIPYYPKNTINFLALYLSTFILCNPKANNNEIEYANSLIIYFVKSFKEIYGVEHMVHNVHNLLHIVDDVRLFGNLDNYSAFPFENFLQSLGKLIRKPSNPIPQIINRLTEMERADKKIVNKKSKLVAGAHKPHSMGPLVGKAVFPQYSEYHLSNYILQCKIPNNCCLLKNGNVILIENIATHQDYGNLVFIGRKFQNIDNFYTEPCPSSKFKIFQVSNLDNNLELWPATDFDLKFVKFDWLENNFIVVPLLHSE